MMFEWICKKKACCLFGRWFEKDLLLVNLRASFFDLMQLIS